MSLFKRPFKRYIEKIKLITPNIFSILDFFSPLLLNNPSRYIDRRRDKTNQIKIKTSLFSKPHPETRSAFDKNFNASASSINPNVILNFFIQMPDFGKFLIIFGKRANIAKGRANEIPKPSIPTVN